MSIPMNIPLSVDGGVSIPLQVGEAVVTEPIVDPTLTISGAAADAKVTGDAIEELKSNLYPGDTLATIDYREVTKVDGHFVNTSGAVSENSSYYYFNVDGLSEGDKVIVWVNYQQSTSIVLPAFRFVCAYDASGNAVSASGATNLSGGIYTVPSGIVKVAITIISTNPTIARVGVLHPNTTVHQIATNPAIETAIYNGTAFSATGDLAGSGKLSISTASVTNNKSICFYGKITLFNEVRIWQGNHPVSSGNDMEIMVDATNLTIIRANATDEVIPHGLTITDYISVVINVDAVGIPTYSIATNGGFFSYTPTTAWFGRLAPIEAMTDANTVLTDCKLSCVFSDIGNPVWIFGDSYISPGDIRWPYWVMERGYKNYLLVGYAGEGSTDAVNDLRKLLTKGTPKTIVWTVGMNNSDGNSDVNVEWETARIEMMAIANGIGADVVLATIPNTPTRNNVHKNTVVSTSGYPYIDFAKAVNAESSGAAWYTGMLSSDNVHPTKYGAIALADAVIKDFPYICNG